MARDRQGDVAAVVRACRTHLDLANMPTDEEYNREPYTSLPLYVLETVFSINAKYQAARNVVDRYSQAVGISDGDEHTVKDFLAFAGRVGPKRLAAEVLKNRQVTSPRNGILKAEAAMLFAATLKDFDVDRLRDTKKILNNDRFRRAVCAIPGQSIALDNFLMRMGRDDLIKADRWVLRFLSAALGGQRVTPDRAYWLLGQAAAVLSKQRKRCSHLTPRLLDNAIWKLKYNPD